MVEIARFSLFPSPKSIENTLNVSSRIYCLILLSVRSLVLLRLLLRLLSLRVGSVICLLGLGLRLLLLEIAVSC